MFKIGGPFPNAQNTRRDGLLMSANSIKVLVVDYKKDLLSYVGDVLHSCSFEVTCVDHSGAALRMLSENNNQFELVLIDSGMTDVDTHTFLRLTKKLDVLSVVMSEQENDAFIHEAFKSGAFLVVKRPLTTDAVRHMRQDVIRHRMHTLEKYKNEDMIAKNAVQNLEIQDTRSSGSRKKGKGEPRKRVHPSSDDEDDDADYNDDTGMKKKICVEWTDELHEKFLNAVRQLGEGRCFPKKILDLMGVPGLTRMQVASHLQKCRKERMNFCEKKPLQNHVLASNPLPQGHLERKFGCMPTLQKDHEESNTLIGINLSINGWQTEVNHMKNQTYKGSSMLNISNQRNIAQRIEYTQIPFGSDLELNQDDGFGTRITKATNNFLQQTISTLRDVGQGANDQNLICFRRQASEEFPDFLKDMDGNGPNDI